MRTFRGWWKATSRGSGRRPPCIEPGVSVDAFPMIERMAWLRLARTETVGPVAFQHLIGRFGTAQRALAALPELARRAGRSQTPAIYSLEHAYAEISLGEGIGAT